MPAVEQVHLDELREWEIDKNLGLRHSSGHFFSLQGRKNQKDGSTRILIDQPEIGLLYTEIHGKGAKIGLDSSVICNVKFEPGNNPFYQLSPTIQKTYSNLKGFHGGQADGIEIFESLSRSALYALLLTEQSDSFLHKKNLNVVNYIRKESAKTIARHEQTLEISLERLLEYILKDRIVHIDLRSCICALVVQVLIEEMFGCSVQPTNTSEIIGKINYKSALNQSRWCSVPLSSIANYNDGYIELINCGPLHKVKVIGVRTTSIGREVLSWDQPLLVCKPEVFHLVFNQTNDVISVLVNISSNGSGTLNEAELSPISTSSGVKKSSISDILSIASTVHESYQTEEGGRFLDRVNKHVIHKASIEDMEELAGLSENICWVDLKQILSLMYTTHLISIELRSILCVLSAYLLVEK
jgi:hypothetical protein